MNDQELRVFNAFYKQILYSTKTILKTFLNYFVCVGVMYSGEYDVCDITLSVHPPWPS
jgi:hypothetical protein